MFLYPITCFGSEFFCLFLLPCEFDTWTKSCILRQEPRASSGALLPCPAGEKVHTTCPHTTQKGFWCRCTITLRGCTLLPGSQLASPYGQLFLDITAHSERDTVKSIIMPTEPSLHIWDHLQYESRYPGLFQLTSFLAKWEKWDQTGSQTVLLLCCQKERQWELIWVPHSHTVKGSL